jgi:hypothetical protein
MEQKSIVLCLFEEFLVLPHATSRVMGAALFCLFSLLSLFFGHGRSLHSW